MEFLIIYIIGVLITSFFMGFLRLDAYASFGFAVLWPGSIFFILIFGIFHLPYILGIFIKKLFHK